MVTGPGLRGYIASDAARISRRQQPAPSSLLPASKARASVVLRTRKQVKNNKSTLWCQLICRYCWFNCKWFNYKKRKKKKKLEDNLRASNRRVEKNCYWSTHTNSNKFKRQQHRWDASVPCHVPMQLEHYPRITGLPPTTKKTKRKTTSVWKNDNDDIINNIIKKNEYCKFTKFCEFNKSKTTRNFTKFPVHSIRSSSIFTYNYKHKKNYDVHSNDTRTNRQGHNVYQRVHSAKSISLYTNVIDQKCNYDDHEHFFLLPVQIHSAAFNIKQSHRTLQSYPRFNKVQSFCCQSMDIQKNNSFGDSMPISQVLLLHNEIGKCQTTKVSTIFTDTPASAKMLTNTTFKHRKKTFSVTKSNCIYRKISRPIETTAYSTDVDMGIGPIYKENRYKFLANTATLFCCKTEPVTSKTTNEYNPKHRKRYRQFKQNKYDDTDNDNTAWFENYPKYLSNILSNNEQSDKLHNTRCNNKKKNRFFLLFYFFALPLLCSTDPLSGSSTTGKFVQKSSLLRTDKFTNKFNNKTDTHRLQKSAINMYSQQQLQKTKTDNGTHPYRDYNWEVNQINPWLSACDLAGPAPADLQGTCGPPEVPKYCPLPCASNTMREQMFRDVIQRLDVPIKWRTGSTATGQWKTKTKGTRMSHSSTVVTLQCLYYLEESHKRDICQDNFGRHNLLSFSTSRENRYWFVSGLRLRHCCELPAINALAPGKGGPLEDVLNGGQKCIDALDKLLIVDALAARLHCEFQEVLARYDCGTPYSVIHNCTHCKVRG